MNCNCVKLCNDVLKKDNAELDTGFTFDFKTGAIGTTLALPLRKLEPSRKPLPSMVVTYCPICGTKADNDRPKKKPVKKAAKKK